MGPFVNQPQASLFHIIPPGQGFPILLYMGKLQNEDHDLHMEALIFELPSKLTQVTSVHIITRQSKVPGLIQSTKMYNLTMGRKKRSK